MSMITADLELSLRRWNSDDYTLDTRFQFSTSAAPVQLITGASPRVRIPFEALLEQQLDVNAYGATLGQALFADPRTAEAFSKARAQAETLGAPLRLRLRLDADDRLHTLRWEILHAPDGSGPLARSERILFSRHLDSADMTPLSIGPRAAVRALVVVAGPDPSDLARYGLAPVDTQAELARAHAALEDIPVSVLASGKGPGATLEAIIAALRDGPTILYLVAHGMMRRGRSAIWLDDSQGGAERVDGVELVEAIARLQRRPLLFMLASCASAGDESGQALVALGPQLAAGGVAAVVAMQGNLAMESAARLLPAFFHELRRDGQIDRAVAAARLSLRGSDDWWQPALFLRVPNGRLWLEDVPPTPSASPALPPPPQPERPPDLAGFVGRVAELDAFEATLAAIGMVVLTGMPGVGKTSMASALARRAGDPNTTFWHSFHVGEGADTVIWAMAGFLARHERPGLWELLQSARLTAGPPPPPKVLIDYLVQLLDGSGLLLCLDDFHLVDDDPLLTAFIERLRPLVHGGRLRLILTSWRVPNFALAEQVELLTGLSPTDAELLLAGRGVVLETAQMVELYTQVGGNAQLLTLAADALRRAKEPAALVGALVEADSIERYLLDAIDVALSAEERSTMKPIAALLEQGGTRMAIEAVADGASVRRPLRSLSDRHLLLTQDAAAGREYRQHIIVQRFYYQELSRRERTELHRRAAAYYESEEPDPLRAAIHYDRAGDYTRAVDLATADIWAMINAGQTGILRQLLERFAVRQSEPDTTRRLDPERWAVVQAALGRAYFQADELKLARQTLEEAWAYLTSLARSNTTVSLMATICTDMGELLQPESPEAAREWLKRGLSAVADSDLALHKAALSIRLGTILTGLADYAAALEAIEQGLALLPGTASHWHISAFINLGLIAFYQGELDRAVEQTRHAMELARQLHDQYRLITILGNLGGFTYILGDWSAALAYTHEALELAGRIGNLIERVRLEVNLGATSINRGADAEAREYFTHSLALSRANNLLEWVVPSLIGLADIHLRHGEVEQAVPLLAKAEQLAQKTNLGYRLPEIHRLWAEVRLARRDEQAALEDIERALAIARELGDTYDEGLSMRIQGQALRATGQSEASLVAYERSLELLAEDPYEMARTQLRLGQALHDRGDTEHAKALFIDAHEVFTRLGAQRDLGEVTASLGM